jgi:hypothetical protein
MTRSKHSPTREGLVRVNPCGGRLACLNSLRRLRHRTLPRNLSYRAAINDQTLLPPGSLFDRLYAKTVERNGCLEYTGTRDLRGGYGVLTLKGKWKKAHRLAYELTKGVIPEGMFVCHTCNNPPCLNSEHLVLGTNAENMAYRNACGRTNKPQGERNHEHKLVEEQVRAIRVRYAEGGISSRALAREFGVSRRTIMRVVHKTHWSHVI